VTYWFPWKHPVARRRGLEFGVFDQTPPKTGSSARFLFSTKLPQPKHRLGPRHSPLSTPLHENTTQMWARPCGPRLWSVANSQVPTFSPFRCPHRGLGHAPVDSDHAKCPVNSATPELTTVSSLEQERVQGTLENWRRTHQLEFCWHPVP